MHINNKYDNEFQRLENYKQRLHENNMSLRQLAQKLR
jgi:hypothetical protein